MKVLIIPTWLPTAKDKIIGQYHIEFAEALVESGEMECDMLFIERRRLKHLYTYPFMKKNFVIPKAGFNIYVNRMMNVAPIDFDWQQKLYVKHLDRALNRYIKTHGKPDILHAQVISPAGYAASVVGKKYGIPVLITEHGCAIDERFEGKMGKYSKKALEHASLSSVSNFTKELFLKHAKQCWVLPNVCDMKVFKNTEKRHIDGTFRLLAVCALRDGKNIEYTFRAMREIIDEKLIPDIHFDVVGDGFLEDYYKEECHKAGTDDVVTFLGRKDKQGIADVMKDNHVLIVNSMEESFCIPGIEALANGMPVISTKCMGPEEYIDDKNGVLVEIDDVKTLKAAIIHVYEHYEEYDPEYLSSCAEKFSCENVARTAKNIYQEVIKNSCNA